MRTFPQESLVRIQKVFLHVTKACNLKCDYCYFSARRPLPHEMSTEEFERLWPDLTVLGPRQVILTGGEPLLRADLFDLLRGLRRADETHTIQRCLNTNGWLVTRDVARQLVGLVDEVRVSLDALEDRNDRHRGRGTFAAALNALDTFAAIGFEPKVLVTVSTETLPDLEELLRLLIAKGFSRINVNDFRAIGRGAAHPARKVDSETVRAILHRMFANRVETEPASSAGMDGDSCRNCGVGTFLNIMPDGDVFPCHVLTSPDFRCGNLRQRRLLEICRTSGLLGELAALDFVELTRTDDRVRELTQSNSCMGATYAKVPDSPVWRQSLRVLPGPPNHDTPRPSPPGSLD